MSDCEFCESFKSYLEMDKLFDEHDLENGCELLHHEYTVAIVRRSFRKGQKSRSGRSTDYRKHGLGFKLNFCPECGRNLKE